MEVPPEQLENNIRRHMLTKFDRRYVGDRDLDITVAIVLKRYEQGNTLEESLEIGERVLEARI